MAKKKMKIKLAAPHTPRRKWTRNPVEKSHSTKHGKKGYDRKSKKDALREETEEQGQ